MTAEDNEYRRRQRQRAQERKKREAAKRRFWLRLLAAGVILLGCGLLIWLVTTEDGEPASTGRVETTQPPAAVAQSAAGPRTTVSVAVAGDVNVNDATVAAGKTASGYDYSQVFQDVVPLLTNADLTVVNFEGNLCGAPYGTETASAPQELMEYLAGVGVDMVQMANSYSIHNGLLGLSATLEGIRATGMEPLGAYASREEFRRSQGYTIREVDGIRIAFVAFTKGMGNLGLPAGSENCVNVLYDDYATTYQNVAKEKIRSILSAVADAQPDYTIALLHWGSEYNDERSSSQEEIRDLMFQNGVDAIVGTHSHMVQQVVFDREAGTFIAYSLGDFFGDAQKAGTNYSVVLRLEITRDNETGEVKLTDYTCTPVYNMKPEESGEPGLRLVRLNQAIQEYEEGYFNRVPEPLYENMVYCRQKVTSRITGEG